MNVNKTVSNNASPKMANRFTTDKKELEKYLKVFCQKIVQVIVQSRLGEKIQTFGNPRSLSNDWVSVQITKIVKICVPSVSSAYSVYIYIWIDA